ncbi:pro-resilin-like isoform X2 [Euwallacea similis]
MASYQLIVLLSLLVLLNVCKVYETAPQFTQRGNLREDETPQPYNYQYKVDSPQSRTLFGKSESGDSQGRVVGNYYVLLPDGRLMNVEYTVDGESGFVPKITFSPANAQGTPASTRLG